MPKEMNGAADTASSIITGKIPMLRIPSPAIQDYTLARRVKRASGVFFGRDVRPVSLWMAREERMWAACVGPRSFRVHEACCTYCMR